MMESWTSTNCLVTYSLSFFILLLNTAITTDTTPTPEPPTLSPPHQHQQQHIRGVQYVLSMMRKCILVKVWEAEKSEKNQGHPVYANCVMHKCIMVKVWEHEKHGKYGTKRKFYEIRGSFEK